jgi:hypothetical protein
MHLHRPTTSWPWTRTLPASLRPEDIRALHSLSRKSGRTIRRLVTDAVLNSLDEAREATSRAA